jgi:hypothetical protein
VTIAILGEAAEHCLRFDLAEQSNGGVSSAGLCSPSSPNCPDPERFAEVPELWDMQRKQSGAFDDAGERVM